MAKPSKAVLDFMAKYKVDSDEIWEVHGSTWVVKHKALERVAAEQNIIWDRPAMLECNSADGVAAMCVFGKLGERMEWSIGEALTVLPDRPGGNYKVTGKQAGYVYAMAEKRAKDRVILKLLSISGQIYSEEESDDFRRPNPHVTRPEDVYDEISDDIKPSGPVKKLLVRESRPLYESLMKEMLRIDNPDDLYEWGQAKADEIHALSGAWPTHFRGKYTDHMKSLKPITNGKGA